jgi:hypothetical protein
MPSARLASLSEGMIGTRPQQSSLPDTDHHHQGQLMEMLERAKSRRAGTALVSGRILGADDGIRTRDPTLARLHGPVL